MLETILDIKNRLKNKEYKTESSVSDQLVKRILIKLGWDIYNPKYVIPEFSINGKRVDLALCYPETKPVVFIEVKKIDNLDGADDQLFNYASNRGIPIAILTDGKEWNFYWPLGRGDFWERKVYSLNILEKDEKEIKDRLYRYLSFEKIKTKEADDNIREDYRNVSDKREAESKIPDAFNKLIEEQNSDFLEIISSKVDSLCGYKATKNDILKFLKSLRSTSSKSTTNIIQANSKYNKGSRERVNTKKDSQQKEKLVGIDLNGKIIKCNSVNELAMETIKYLAGLDRDYLENYNNEPKHGIKRRYIAKNKYELYPDRADLAEKHSIEFLPGWWFGTNNSTHQVYYIIKISCKIAGLNLGKDYNFIYEKNI